MQYILCSFYGLFTHQELQLIFWTGGNCVVLLVTKLKYKEILWQIAAKENETVNFLQTETIDTNIRSIMQAFIKPYQITSAIKVATRQKYGKIIKMFTV